MSQLTNCTSTSNICFINNTGQAGTYILRINLSEEKTVVFGRFDKGRPIHLEKGEYLYIGSALSSKGSTTLGNRIQRHCDRTPPKPPHDIRPKFQDFCDAVGIKYTNNPADKTPFWNIDHLTNLIEAEIIGIIAIRYPEPLENTWSEYIESQPYTSVFAKGLGANDNEGHTHLQKSEITNSEWSDLVKQLPRTIE